MINKYIVLKNIVFYFTHKKFQPDMYIIELTQTPVTYNISYVSLTLKTLTIGPQTNHTYFSTILKYKKKIQFRTLNTIT